MQPFAGESRPICIWKQMRKIEDELFLLSGQTGELDVEDRPASGVCVANAPTWQANYC